MQCITFQNQARLFHLVHAYILPRTKDIFNTGNFLVNYSLLKEEHRSFFAVVESKNIAKTFTDHYFVFLQGYIEKDSGEPIWLGHIVPNVVNNELQKPPLWESDKRITLFYRGCILL